MVSVIYCLTSHFAQWSSLAFGWNNVSLNARCRFGPDRCQLSKKQWEIENFEATLLRVGCLQDFLLPTHSQISIGMYLPSRFSTTNIEMEVEGGWTHSLSGLHSGGQNQDSKNWKEPARGKIKGRTIWDDDVFAARPVPTELCGRILCCNVANLVYGAGLSTKLNKQIKQWGSNQNTLWLDES